MKRPDHFYCPTYPDGIPFANIASGDCGFLSMEEAEAAEAAAKAAGYTDQSANPPPPPDGEASDTDGAEDSEPDEEELQRRDREDDPTGSQLRWNKAMNAAERTEA